MVRQTTLPEPWKSLADSYGGVAALAEAFCTVQKTLHNWAHGVNVPSGPARKLIVEAFTKAHLPIPAFGRQSIPPASIPEPWQALAEAHGGVEALAKALGKVPSTVYQWAEGKRKLGGPARVQVLAAFKTAGIKPPKLPKL